MAAILTMLGVAIGLGNVWRFPYMMGRYGGSAFLFVYILLTLVFAFPALIAEMSLGRISRQGTIGALKTGFGSRGGKIAGYFFTGVVTIAGSYYAVVVANVFFTAGFSLFPGFAAVNNKIYDAWLANPLLQYFLTLLLIVAAMLLIRQGLVAGIERISKRFMPFFFLALVYMIVHALTLPGAGEKFVQFLNPDFSQMGVRELFAALGQAFFSVGLGGTFIVTYSGYLTQEERIPHIALFTALGDAGASLLFSLFLIPSILVFGLDMTQGPRLIFHTFPELFAAMPGGRIVGPLFLFPLATVAFLSLVAAYQVPYTTLSNEWQSIRSSRWLLVIGVVQAVLAIPSAWSATLIGYLDLIFGSGMQVLGSAVAVVCLTWGLSRNTVMAEMFNADQMGLRHRLVYTWMRWVIPLALTGGLASYIIEAI